MTNHRIPVWVKALDPLSQFGLVHALRQRPEIALLTDADLAQLTPPTAHTRTATAPNGHAAAGSNGHAIPGANGHAVAGSNGHAVAAPAVAAPAVHRRPLTGPPVIGLIAADSLDPVAIQVLRAATKRGCRRTVLIGGTIDDEALMTAVELGVSGVLRRSDATADRIVHLVRSAAAGDGSLPPDLLGRLLGQVSRMQRHVLAPRGLSHTGLSDRETQVLRLVADGKDTQEIARELSYSERTVKNVLHDVTSRLHLRNRSHAVAYALREGLI
ncbi:response regulator transcription factor [Kribbella sp. NBC_01245]|uniref:response regulator transcription factor n=1 Tax=Kribbella sp. NBC_01245 TaxID=2903578 RepID=UPI002E2E6513|nr:response regulator transcription factor [Kribbella sp. NBC_01245]